MQVLRRLRRVIGVVAVCGLAAGLAPTVRAAASGGPGASAATPPDFMAAIDAVVAGEQDPVRARGTLLLRLRAGPHCYANDLTQEQLEQLIEQTWLWPPAMGRIDAPTTRFFSDGKVWTGEGQIGDRDLAIPASLTYSFPDDGVAWGLSGAGFTGANTLGADLIAGFGSLDKGREYIRAALASWRRSSGLTYTEVADDNSPMIMSTTRSAARGDIRIGGFPFAQGSPNGFLAYNAFPTNQSMSSLGGGDMAINSQYFLPSTFLSTISDYRYFRNTVAHEHGHGLGCLHTIPCDQTKLMEPMISLGPNMLTRDEIRAAGRNYGDRFAGNHSRPSAAELGNFSTPVQRAVILRDLSAANSGAPGHINEDYFRFTIDTPQAITITVQPTGDNAQQGQQVGQGCTGTATLINALSAGNLNLSLVTPAGALVAAAPAQPAGSPETLTIPSLAPGTYVVSIINNTSAAQAAPNQYIQTYDLTIRAGSALAPPQAIAGVHKRVLAGQPAFFNGSVNSRPLEEGATIPASGYEWDLDGDGTFETGGAQPTFTYVSNGVYPATLRITDSNGLQATDAINVTVFGATTVISSVSPSSAQPGLTVPVTIFGANLRGVTSASQVTVSGGGVTVSGTPVVDALGTQITGLSFTVSGGAGQSARDVTITNSDGQGASGTGNAVFSVGEGGQPPVNDECEGAVSWGSALGTLPFSNIAATTGQPQSFPSTGCPAAGPIASDVWYTWTAPNRGTLTVNTDSAAQGFASRVAMYRNNGCVFPASTLLRCDDNGTPFTVSVNTGASYLFQVGSVTPGAMGAANVILSLNPSMGACCIGGACTVTPEGDCLNAGGDWTFAGTCTPGFCPEVDGACCITGSCFINSPAECAALGPLATWQGEGTTCGQPGNPTTCCPANFNQVGGLTVQDLFDFLAAWFAAGPGSDFNSDGVTTLQDLFDYLVAYFNNCA